MKVQVNLTVKANAEENSTFSLVVGATDTVSNVKERVTALQLIPFSENDLKLSGEVLEDGKRLSDYGVKEGASLDFEVKAAESSLVRQLTELLQARDLSSDELGLLYCYKHGVNISQSLKLIGHDGKFAEFLKKQKAIALESGRVSLTREDTSLKPFSLTDEVADILKKNSGTLDIKDLKSHFAEKFNVGFASIAGMKPMEFLAKHKDVFVVTGRHVSLKSQQADQAQDESSACSSPKQHIPLAPPGLESVVAVPPAVSENQKYLDLHQKIRGIDFGTKTASALTSAVDCISKVAFLNVDHIVKGGSIGKGTAISGVTDAEAVFFLNGLPAVGHEDWLPGLVKAVAGVLSLSKEEMGVNDDILSDDDSLALQFADLTVRVKFSPVFESHARIIQTLKECDHDARKYYTTSLAKERVQFIAKQPESVKMTMRLMKWWREQQRWTDAMCTPSDDVIELLVVYSTFQSKAADQHAAVMNVMALMSQFNDLRIVWSNYYSKDDVSAPLLRQRPLLLDPTNPFVNVADPTRFDAREMMSFASNSRFFW
jgi:hypothetical protein